jgi:hypothetical protein
LFATEKMITSLGRFALLALLGMGAAAADVGPAPAGHKKKCVVAHNATQGADDSPAILAAVAECSSNAIIVFDEKYTYNALTPIALRGLRMFLLLSVSLLED